MRIKNPFRRPWIVLLVLSSVLGIYKAATLSCISRDSILFLEYSQHLGAHPAEAVTSYDQHPGFPFLLFLLRTGMESMGGELSIRQTIAAGQAVNLACWIAALCILFLIFQHFTSSGKALVQTLFVMAIPAYADNASDVLSDWPALLPAAVSLLFCLKGIRTLRLPFFLAAGIASGAAYLIRPEGLVFVIVTGLYVMIRLVFGPERNFKLLAGFGILLASALVLALPYMFYKGAIFPKKDIGTFGQAAACLDSPDAGYSAGSDPDAVLPATAALPKPVEGLVHLLIKVMNVLFLLAVPWFSILIYKGLLFGRLRKPDQFLALFAGLWLLLMIWLYTYAGYISQRHILLLIVFTFAWLGEGIERMIGWFTQKPKTAIRGMVWFSLAAAALFVPKLLRPDRLEKGAYPEAGRWLQEHTPTDTRLAVFDTRIGFYADRVYEPLPGAPLSACDYLVVKTPRKTATVIPQTAQKVETGIDRVDEQMEIYRLGAANPARRQ